MFSPASSSAKPRSHRLRVSSLSSSAKFPLPDEAFAFARLSTTQLHAHEQQIHRLIAHALDECHRADVMGRTAYNDPWEVVGAQDNVTAWWRNESLSSFTPAAFTATGIKTSQYRLIGDVVGDYRDLMALYYADTSNDLYEWLQFMNQSILDAHIIQTVESQSPSQPHRYFGVKWAAFQTSMFATKVDQCFVEYMTYCTDRRGREVGVRVTLPIRMPEIDLTTVALKVRRMASTMVQIFRPVNDKTTRLFVLAENDAPPAVYAKTLLAQTQQTRMAMDAHRIRRHGILAEKHWIPNASRSSCVVCARTFGAARGRHHCRLCGDVICRKCTVVRDTAEPITHKTFKVTKTKCCVLCIVNLRGQDTASEAAAMDLSASTVAAVKASSTFSTDRRMDDLSMDGLVEGTRWSVRSESDSETYTGDFDCTDITHLLSGPSITRGKTNSYERRLQEIAERSEDSVVERTSDWIETIDTKDMLRGILAVEHAVESTCNSFDSFTKKRSRTDSLNLLATRATRSLDENLAEQEALLRQLALASRNDDDPGTYPSEATA